MKVDPDDLAALLELATELSRAGDTRSLALLRILALVQYQPPKKGKSFLTTGGAAKLLGVSTQTVANWCDEGKLQSFRTPGGDRRIPAETLTNLFAESHGGWRPVCPGCAHVLKNGQCKAATMFVTRINDPEFPFLPGDEDNCRAAVLIRHFGGKTHVSDNRILHDGRFRETLLKQAKRPGFHCSPCELPGYGHDPRSRARQFGVKLPHCFAYNELEEGCSAMHSGKAKDVHRALKTCPAYGLLLFEGFAPSFDEYGKLWI